jgi:hypothetical protein
MVGVGLGGFRAEVVGTARMQLELISNVHYAGHF